MLLKILENINNKTVQIKLLGDSITHGIGGSGFCQDGEVIIDGYARNTKGFCWAKLFKEYLEERYNCQVVNNACSGTNIEFIINNFHQLVDENDDLVICTIGTNNRHQLKNEKPKKTRNELGAEFYNNILQLNEIFIKNRKPVIFVANIPASVGNEQDGEDFWRTLHMSDINAIYKKAQAQDGFPFISMYDLMCEYINEQSIRINDLLCDGLHPNDEGYRVYFNLIKESLEIGE